MHTMELRLRKKRIFPILLLLLLVGVLSLDYVSAQNRINRQRGNILKNLTRTHEYDNHIVTSQLDASTPIRMFYRGFREVYNRLLGPTGGRLQGAFLQPHVMPNVPFPCDTRGMRSSEVPTSVHQLRPGDIDIISAVGDSLTSATAANSIALWELLIENRGLAWCIGGQGTWRTHLTLPNILKEFNPKLFGYSLFDSYNVHHTAQFNVAENIATTTDMPYNAAKLVDRMKLDPRVKWEKHWKLLTFMIGGNDFCSDVCYQTNATEWINEVQEKYLIKTLLYLKHNMPRTIVNLVPTPLISLSFSMDKAPHLPFSCYLSRPIECSCLFGPRYSHRRNLYHQLERNFAKIMERVSYLPDFHSDDFTVVYQPFFKEASVFYQRDGKADMSIMSVDCVHLSQKGHAVSANGLWNNMLEPTGSKTVGFRKLFEDFKCPTVANPYIRTYFNS